MAILFAVLGNETRRRILRLLADEPRYLLQLAKELEVSQQAILKHLDLLERYDLVNSYEEESKLAAPPRKYYELAKSFYMTVGLAGDTCCFTMQEVPPQIKEPVKCPAELRQLVRKLQDLEATSDPMQVLESADTLLSELNEEVRMQEEVAVALLCLKQRALNLAHSKIREASDKLLERRILYTVLGSGRQIDVDLLSEELNAREKEIREALEVLQRRLHFFERKREAASKAQTV